MPIVFFNGWYSPELCQKFPDTIFVFGDNARRIGMGGQAIIRPEPNVYGISTKRVGDMKPSSFFYEGNEKDRQQVDKDLEGLRLLLVAGKTCVIPVEKESDMISLGLERAKLRETAPSLYDRIDGTIRQFAEEYGEVELGSVNSE